jgi:5-oxoprolinase (ATP-hydrolysing) subunit A
MLSIDLNCDMGESTALWDYHIEKDLSLFPFISSVNLACGFHAGDAQTMHELVDAALPAGIAIGAHPGFLDRGNFGRSNMPLSPQTIYDIVLYQVGALNAFLKIHGTRLHHVKPHGALYNMAAKDRVMADAICMAIKDYDPGFILYGLSGSELINAAHAAGLKSCSEVFADRSYQDDGTLTPRTEAGAMITDVAQCVQHVLQMVQRSTVTTVSGKEIALQADSICIHGDGEHALAFAQHIHQSLKKHGIEIKPI